MERTLPEDRAHEKRAERQGKARSLLEGGSEVRQWELEKTSEVEAFLGSQTPTRKREALGQVKG